MLIRMSDLERRLVRNIVRVKKITFYKSYKFFALKITFFNWIIYFIESIFNAIALSLIIYIREKTFSLLFSYYYILLYFYLFVYFAK